MGSASTPALTLTRPIQGKDPSTKHQDSKKLQALPINRASSGAPRGKIETPDSKIHVWLSLALALGLCGCAGRSAREASFAKAFTFGKDNFSYANDLKWVYYKDPETGKFRHKGRVPPPDYTHHCFAVARSARQFFQHARFDPTLPKADEATYRKLIRRVVKTSPRTLLKDEERIVIPGFTNLFTFSQAYEKLLQDNCGGAWQSYFQRGHWRMIHSFSRGHQEKAAQSFRESLQRNRPPIIHIVRFPQLSINHAIVLIDVREKEGRLEFVAYDPYDPLKPTTLTFNLKERQFYFPPNDYFIGGKTDAYEVYCSWNY